MCNRIYRVKMQSSENPLWQPGLPVRAKALPFPSQKTASVMLMPIGDDNRDRNITPWVNYVFLGLNIIVFLVLQQAGQNLYFTYSFATVPAEILTGQDIVTQSEIYVEEFTQRRLEIPGLQITPVSVYLTLITSMFMHGGWGHLFGNMLYLYIFGDNIENRLGHWRYFCFYLVCGVLASLAHVFSTFLSPGQELIPSLGASGAISGVLGANLILFPSRRVNALVGWFIVEVPLLLAIGLWIGFQVISGIGMLGGKSDGVAYAAHIGGFVAGMLLIKLFDNRRRKNPLQAYESRRFRYRQ
jgi:membrane associated rhomboid family serine protease